MKGISDKTESVLIAISNLECLKPYILVGGTALSLQLATRESEDLDFMSWRQSKDEKREVDWPTIKKELETIGKIDNFDLIDLDHVEFIFNGIKLSFYANPNYSPIKDIVPLLNNINMADKKSIGAMKMEVMLRRSKFRDYYDIYSLLKEGVKIDEMISIALNYSKHKLKSKNLIAMLINSDRFLPDSEFKALNPVYDVTPKEIEKEIRRAIDLSKKMGT